jgi:predicted nucleotidyltransferase
VRGLDAAWEENINVTKSSSIAVREALEKWGQSALQYGTPELYVFGSLVYKDGSQFGVNSDVDLVVVLPNMASDAVGRAEWLEGFLNLKEALETVLLRALQRKNADEQIASIVAVTKLELEMDIHKDGQGGFNRSPQHG